MQEVVLEMNKRRELMRGIAYISRTHAETDRLMNVAHRLRCEHDYLEGPVHARERAQLLERIAEADGRFDRAFKELVQTFPPSEVLELLYPAGRPRTDSLVAQSLEAVQGENPSFDDKRDYVMLLFSMQWEARMAVAGSDMNDETYKEVVGL